jgi:pSer/pThr/pTyr-binding forkhead associated (FHA) protein
MMASAVARLIALTDEAVHALGGTREVPISAFPARFGRERRSSEAGVRVAEDLRRDDTPPLNDVYLRELPDSTSFHISGEHFEIEYADGRFFLVDRGSACGTIVGGLRVGGRAELRDGDEIVVGTSHSRYIYRFTLVGDDLGHA